MRSLALAARPSGEEAEPAPEIQSQRDSPHSFDEIYEQWFHEVCRWARALGGLNADVEDIAQEVFLVVRRKLDDFDGKYARAWLYRITQRKVSDYRRRSWFRRAVYPKTQYFEDVVDGRDGPREIVARRQAEIELGEILDKLSKVRRSAFILYELEGYSGDEIAELEGVPVKTVYTRLHHARKDFLKYVEQRRRAEEGRA